MYDVPEQMQDQWRERLRTRRRSAAWLTVAAAAFIVAVILLGP